MQLGYAAWADLFYRPAMSRPPREAFPWSVRGRRSMRLPDRDYRQPGAYFITICTKNRARTFGAVISGTVHLSPEGEIAQGLWLAIPRHFPNAQLDTFVVMPDHIHGILILLSHPDAQPRPRRFADAVPASISTILGAYKAEVTKRLNALRDAVGTIWQRNFYERVIRGANELQAVRAYIRDNPGRWALRTPRDR